MSERRSVPGRTSWAQLRPVLTPPLQGPALAGWALLPLRAFLGVTFCYAGLQKLSNPQFFAAANPISIQSQMAAAVRRSPVHALIHPLTHIAVPIGIVLAVGELAVGMGTLVGLWTRVAAVGGAIISLSLLLTVSFHSSPYYTGADIVFLAAWAPFMVAGSGGVLSADAALAELRKQAKTAPAGEAGTLDRRTFAAEGLMAGVVALGTLLAGGVAAGAGRLAGRASRASGTPALNPVLHPNTSSTTTVATSTPPEQDSTTTSTAPATSTPQGTTIGPASAVPVGGAAQFSDPATGDPSLVVQPKEGSFVAFDAVCPHAGCIVGYDTRSKIFVCPCHGSRFNGRTGTVVAGPATVGLTPITVAEGPDGQLYVT